MRRLVTIALVLVVVAAAGSLAIPAAPVHAQSGVIWNVEYYSNAYLSGDPVLERQESGREFYWAGSSPGAGVPADYFSARFATDVYFPAGTYRFYILADDGVKLWIDFPPDKRPTLDTYNAPQPGSTLVADVTLAEGSHHIQIDYRENTGDAYLYVSWDRLGVGTTGPNFNPPPVQVTWQAQWTAQYFNNTYLGGSPALSRSEPSPNQNWGYDAPGPGVLADNFSARWIVYQEFEQGNYTVTTSADDGVRVNVDGRYVINEWHIASGQAYSATFPLTAGPHSIVVEYYDAGAIASINFRMVRESQGQPTVQPVTGAIATITAYRLNVRSAPSTGTILRTVSRGEVYPVVGRNADSSWWQINADGTIGWVSGRYVSVVGGSSVTVADGNTPQTVTYGQCPGFMPSRLAPGNYGRVTPGLPNTMRTTPGYAGLWVGQIPGGGVFYVLQGPACANDTAWYQVLYNGIVGWTAEGQGTTYWLELVVTSS